MTKNKRTTKHYTETKDWATQTLQKQAMNSGAYLWQNTTQKLKIEQHKPYKNRLWTQVLTYDKTLHRN
jgi:hypothetical protein